MKKVLLLIPVFMALAMMNYTFERSDFVWQLGLYIFLFALYYISIYQGKIKFGLKEGLIAAIALRLLLLPAVPVLSDDFYRFIFDGQLIANGLNPYAFLPVDAVDKIQGQQVHEYWGHLLSQMNSPEYYSVYPPLHQLFFWISALVGERLIWNVVLLRLAILFSESLNFLLLYKIIKLKNLPIKPLWLYAFNPLVILELTGNLHFEGFVLTGLLFGFYFWEKKKVYPSALGWSLASGLKLTPLILGPLWLKVWPENKVVKFLLVSAILIAIFLMPLFFGNGYLGFLESFRLYQSKFEFNASIYFVIREIWAGMVGYNPLIYLGPILSMVTLVSIVVFSYFWKTESFSRLVQGAVWIYLIYLLLQPVVHPWYLIPAFGIGVLIQNRIFLFWTGLVFLSYGAYSGVEVEENFVLIMIEYFILFFVIISAFKNLKPFSVSPNA
ncbi:carotene biosynthesis protein [Mongoliibacter ruber]|nr:carotene biosynthesis protein [Mongoliibacter ruber]